MPTYFLLLLLLLLLYVSSLLKYCLLCEWGDIHMALVMSSLDLFNGFGQLSHILRFNTYGCGSDWRIKFHFRPWDVPFKYLLSSTCCCICGSRAWRDFFNRTDLNFWNFLILYSNKGVEVTSQLQGIQFQIQTKL